MDMVIFIAILVFSAILHEIMHGWVADKLGDPTARLMGRLTLNPIPHIDPLMSIIVPILMYIGSGGSFMFASAKPVPVNPLNLEDPKKDMALVSLAGPATNIAIALIVTVSYKLLGTSSILLHDILLRVIVLNLLLAIVNLIPIPPLDGSKVLASVLPSDIARQYLSIEQFGMFLLLFLFVTPVGGFSLGGIVNNLLVTALRLLGI